MSLHVMSFRTMYRLARRMTQIQYPTTHRECSWSPASRLRQRSVVSSFICTSPQSPSGLTFALFRRSEDVSTYRGKWAVCSGSVEPSDASPQTAAKREILEETGLTDRDISLLRRGKPFSLIDKELRTEWTIHPFAWQLKDGAKEISLDWEHTEHKFIKPEDLSTYDHVPQLELGLERVMVSPETERGLAILRDDHDSGAQSLAVKALVVLLEMAQGKELQSFTTAEGFWSEFRWRAWHLAKNGGPSMDAAIEAKLFKALDLINQEAFPTEPTGRAVPLSTVKDAVLTILKSGISEGEQSLAPIANRFVTYVKSNYDSEGSPAKLIKVVTSSASGTTHACLTALVEALTSQEISLEVTFLESRPKFEGAIAATTLLHSFTGNAEVMERLTIKVIPDAGIATAVEDADYVIFGGDRVFQTGDVRSRIGSYTAAVTAKALNPGCRVVALFETEKVTTSGFHSEYTTVESNDEVELTKSWPADVGSKLVSSHHDARIRVRNEYIDWVPAKFIDVHISEQGSLSEEDMNTLGCRALDLESRLFRNL